MRVTSDSFTRPPTRYSIVLPPAPIAANDHDGSSETTVETSRKSDPQRGGSLLDGALLAFASPPVDGSAMSEPTVESKMLRARIVCESWWRRVRADASGRGRALGASAAMGSVPRSALPRSWLRPDATKNATP